MISDYIAKIINGKDLSYDEMRDAIDKIMSGEVSDTLIAAFLSVLRMKGETTDEIFAAAEIMRSKSSAINIAGLETIDIVGTGGDELNTFNISTCSAIVAAGAGLVVSKHGNRSVSSNCGSADVLEELGVNLDLSPEEVKECVRQVGLGFLYAPTFHKAMRFVGPARKALGLRTIFNVLGPLTNPMSAANQVTGVFDENLTEIMAEVLKKLGLNRTIVVHGEGGFDELTITGKTKISELKDGIITTYYITPEELGLDRCKVEDLTGGDPKENAEIAIDLLRGKKGSKRDMLLLNSGAALYVGGKTETIKQGLVLAKEVIDSGKAYKKLEALIKYTNKEGN
jgi:anthranilate phosphoribosyltransferase